MKLTDYYIHTQALLEVADYLELIDKDDYKKQLEEDNGLYDYFTQWYRAIVEIAEDEYNGKCTYAVATLTIQEWYDELSFHEKLTLTEIPPYVTTTH